MTVEAVLRVCLQVASTKKLMGPYAEKVWWRWSAYVLALLLSAANFAVIYELVRDAHCCETVTAAPLTAFGAFQLEPSKIDAWLWAVGGAFGVAYLAALLGIVRTVMQPPPRRRVLIDWPVRPKAGDGKKPRHNEPLRLWSPSLDPLLTSHCSPQVWHGGSAKSLLPKAYEPHTSRSIRRRVCKGNMYCYCATPLPLHTQSGCHGVSALRCYDSPSQRLRNFIRLCKYNATRVRCACTGVTPPWVPLSRSPSPPRAERDATGRSSAVGALVPRELCCPGDSHVAACPSHVEPHGSAASGAEGAHCVRTTPPTPRMNPRNMPAFTCGGPKRIPWAIPAATVPGKPETTVRHCVSATSSSAHSTTAATSAHGRPTHRQVCPYRTQSRQMWPFASLRLQ